MENNFSRILGERLIKITTISKDTGIARSTLTSFYYKRGKGISFDVLMKICDYLDVELSEIINYKPLSKKKKEE